MAAKSLEYRHLEVFRAVMRSGSVTGAGALLGVSQPAVSRLLAQTEALAGFPLFERIRGRLVPTPLAHALHEEVERVFIGVEEISALTERLRQRSPRRILLASIPVLTLSLLPRVAVFWREARREVPLAVHSRTVGGVLGMVASRQADIGLSTGLHHIPGLRSAKLARARAYCAMAAASASPRSRWFARPISMARPISPCRARRGGRPWWTAPWKAAAPARWSWSNAA